VAGINLTKDQIINLSKAPAALNESTGLRKVSFGLDWGMISRGGILGFGKTKEKVDLDASAVLMDANKNIVEIVYFGNQTSSKGTVRHSGDDRGGDDADDGKDNEVIKVNLECMTEATHVAFVLNSYSGQDFGQLPYVRIRAYTGDREVPLESQILGKMELSKDPSYNGKTSMVMGIVSKVGNEWTFKAVGQATSDRDVRDLARSSRNFV
jgi:tellurium resistance protein TerZ